MSTCRVCQTESTRIFSGKLLGGDVDYFECSNCGYVQTADPHWLERAYNSAINSSDTGIMARNLLNAKIVLSTLWVLNKTKGVVVDYAGGYGILVRLLRDAGVNALWTDSYSENLLSRGFEYSGGSVDLVAAFEVFEHFVNPIEELDRLLSVSDTVLLSTEMIPSPTPKQDAWWYYGKNHGQHIGFFRVRTFEYIAQQFGLHFATNGRNYHLLSKQPVNRGLWRVALKLKNVVSFLAKSGLSSMTEQDHAALVTKEIGQLSQGKVADSNDVDNRSH